MSSIPLQVAIRTWPGIDEALRDAIRAEVMTDDGRRRHAQIVDTLFMVRGKPCTLGNPVVIKRDHALRLVHFARAYHRAIETIVRAWPHDAAVRAVLHTPTPIDCDIEQYKHGANDTVHLCRLDLHLDRYGGFRVLETNANCPGALMSSGIASASWREFLDAKGYRLPVALDHEGPDWTARWFIENAIAETGSLPSCVALIRERGGNQLELPGLAREFERLGIEPVEADPRDLALDNNGDLVAGDRRVRHGYLKLGLQALTHMRPHLDSFMSALRHRRIFVQNGLRARLIGDNKLCLAILSDPSFGYLFDCQVTQAVRAHIPWSRALARCTEHQLRTIRQDKNAYVLKNPHDTRGHGVIIGRELRSHTAWAATLARATRAAWLVQEFCETTELGEDPEEFSNRHDLCLGLINGRLAGAFARSGSDLRLNIARTGKLHPIFMPL